MFALYDRYGGDNYDEQLSQLAHAEQTAALAVVEGADESLVAAALLHDVGHLLYLAGEVKGPHEDTGAQYLASLFAGEVTEPIRLHVPAKRCLCATDPIYWDGLSDGSKRSLERQGGPFTADEADAFMASLGAADAVRLRRWDDQGKVDGLPVAPLRTYEPLLRRLVRRA